MKLFIDSADIHEIEAAYQTGIIDGVTTNPSLIKKALKNVDTDDKNAMRKYIARILRVARGTPVSLEVTETTYEGMVAQGVALYKLFNPIAKNVYIKIPVSPAFNAEPNDDSIRAIHELSRLKIPVNCTLIFTPEQALLAAKAGAKFVSPFVGRIDDYIRSNAKMKFDKSDYYSAYGIEKRGTTLEDNGIVSGVDLIDQIVSIFKKHDIKTEVLAASLRNTRQVREVALSGAHIATLPYPVIQKLLYHYKTVEGMKKFTADIVPEYTELTQKKKVFTKWQK